MSEVAAENNVPSVQEGEKRGRKRNTGNRTNTNATHAEAELLTKGLNNTDDVDGRRTTRSSTRGSTAASKLKNEPPAKKEKKTPAVKGKRGRPKAVSKEESEEAVSAEENGIADNDVDSKADKGGSSTEEEVDSKTEDKIENGNSSTEEEKKVEDNKESTDESDKPAVTEAKKESSSP
jgi:hypothetical protein